MRGADKLKTYYSNINMLERSYAKLPTQLYEQTGMLCIMTFVGPRPSLDGKLQAFSSVLYCSAEMLFTNVDQLPYRAAQGWPYLRQHVPAVQGTRLQASS